MGREHGPTVGATETSLAIVERLAANEGVGVSELAEALDLSKSTVHNHLQTLRELGYVLKSDGEYRVSLQFLGLGDQARQRHGLYHVAKSETDSLVEAVGERAQVMVEENDAGIYIYQSLADQAVRTDSHIGTVVNLHSTAVGKSYLAHMPAEERDALLDRIGFDEQTPNTILERKSLESELSQIAEQGYAFNDEEKTLGMRAVGASILSDDGELLGAISVSGPKNRLSGSWYHEQIPEMVTQSARVIGIKATYS
jgi:DNA-binding IclR family transcriptional regulator